MVTKFQKRGIIMRCFCCKSDANDDINKKYTMAGDIIHEDSIYTKHSEYFCSVKCFHESNILETIHFNTDPNTLTVQQVIDKLNKISDKNKPLYFADEEFNFHSINDIREETKDKVLLMEL